MKTANESLRIYDTILSIPGMQDEIKLQSRIPRKNVLLLHQVMERGLGAEAGGTSHGLLEALPKESVQQIRETMQDWLKQAGLAELQAKLQQMG